MQELLFYSARFTGRKEHGASFPPHGASKPLRFTCKNIASQRFPYPNRKEPSLFPRRCPPLSCRPFPNHRRSRKGAVFPACSRIRAVHGRPAPFPRRIRKKGRSRWGNSLFQERDTGGNSKKPFLYSISDEAAALKGRALRTDPLRASTPALLPLSRCGIQEAWRFLFSYISISALRKSSLTEDASEG